MISRRTFITIAALSSAQVRPAAPLAASHDIAELVEAAAETADRYTLPDGPIALSRPIRVRRSGFVLAGHPSGNTTLTINSQDAPIILIGDRDFDVSNVHISRITFASYASRQRIAGRQLDPMNYRIPARAWAAGIIHVRGGALTVKDASFSNLDCGVMIKGDAFDKTRLSTGFSIENCVFRNCEFGIVAQQFAGASIVDVTGVTTTMVHEHPPHLVYITDRSAATSRNLRIDNLIDVDNVFSSSLRVRNIRGLQLTNIRSFRCSRSIDLGRCEDVWIKNYLNVAPRSNERQRRALFDVRDSRNVQISSALGDILPDQAILRVADDQSPLLSDNIELRDSFFRLVGRPRSHILFDVRDGTNLRFYKNVIHISDEVTAVPRILEYAEGAVAVAFTRVNAPRTLRPKWPSRPRPTIFSEVQFRR